jgi:hypothetical protein
MAVFVNNCFSIMHFIVKWQKISAAFLFFDYSAEAASAAALARCAFHSAIAALFSGVMFQITRNANQDPIAMIAGIRIHISLIPMIASAGCTGVGTSGVDAM